MGKLLEFYMATNAGKGSGVQLHANGNSEVFFEMAQQTPGTNQQSKSFDWKNKSFFGLNNQEVCDVIEWFKFVITQGADNELKFPHLASSQPKNIVFKYQNYQGKFQVVLSVFPANQNNHQGQTNPQNGSKMFCFNLKQFTLVTKVLKGNLEKKLNSTGLYDSLILDEGYNILKKQMFLPKMQVNEKICTEKKNPENKNLVIREFLLIVDVTYNATTQQMIYVVRK